MMDVAAVDVRGVLEEIELSCNHAADRFRTAHGEQVENYRRLIGEGIDDALAELQAEMSTISGGNEVVRYVGDQMSAYVEWMQWSLWDLPVLAVALGPDPDDFRDAVTACGLAYVAIRAFDDVIDDHFTYKGRRDTLLGTVSVTYNDVRRARGLSTLAALLLCFEGFGRLASGRTSSASVMLTGVLRSLRRAVIGAMMEYTPERLSNEDYVRMVRLKNVDYWRALYSSLDAEQTSPLYPFLAEYYEVAQYLNDVEDYDDDVLRGQPNLLTIRNESTHLRAVDDPRPWAVSAEVEAMLADRIVALAAFAEGLSGVERMVAETKLSDLLASARAVGLFTEVPAADGRHEPDVVADLFVFSELPEVIAQFGREAITDIDCVACGSADRHEVFRKQGFHFHRCRSCSHMYVSPRISAEAQERLVTAFKDDGTSDRYLEVQRIYAEHICDLLRKRTAGPRLLDIGFGRGYLLQMAQVYGFEAYGIDGAVSMVEPLRPLFGNRVAHAIVGRDPLPWRSFDVVVIAHVLEHLTDPGAALRDIASIMNDGGWIYVAVPDIGSMDFKIFGKRWDVINPLVHLQYFTEESLTKILESAGFERVTRIRHPHLRDEVSPRWMRLMRQLGGSDSSELTLLAKLPDDPARYPLASTD
jgi:SAM-dependent methyltransferase